MGHQAINILAPGRGTAAAHHGSAGGQPGQVL